MTLLIREMTQHLKIFLEQPTTPIKDIFQHCMVCDEFVSEFATYLAKDALTRNKKQLPLSLQTCLNYISAFRQYVILSIGRDNDIPNCLKEACYSNYSTLIYRHKRIHSNGKPLVTPRETATEDDRRAFGALCLWLVT